MATGKDAAAVKTGPGLLYIAEIGTAEPISLTGALDAAWIPLGYTTEGSAGTFGRTTENVEVAEELDPVAVQATGRVLTYTFTLAQDTAKNLDYVNNGGTIVNAGQFFSFEPPALGTEKYRMLLWQDLEPSATTRRLLFRKVQQTSESESPRRKGNTITGWPVVFTAFKPTGAEPWKSFYHPSLSGL